MSKKRQSRPRRHRCALCGELYEKLPNQLKGICSRCSMELDGGRYAGAGKREERQLLRRRDAGGIEALEAPNA